MYSADPKINSAKHIWDQAKPCIRLQLLREAGYSGGHAYRKFDELPMTVKLDLNYVATRKKSEAAA